MAVPIFWFNTQSGRDDAPPPSLRVLRTQASERAAVGADESTVAQLRAGDESALAAVFDAHYDRLCNYALRLLGSVDLAESAVLDVMTSLWERRAALAVRGTLRGYLTGAVRLRAANMARAQRTEQGWEERAGREEHLPGLARAPRPADARVTDLEIERAVADAVEMLPPRCRTVFEMAWYAGLTYGEIAAQLQISVKGVEGQMARAYRTLRGALAHLTE